MEGWKTGVFHVYKGGGEGKVVGLSYETPEGTSLTIDKYDSRSTSDANVLLPKNFLLSGVGR